MRVDTSSSASSSLAGLVKLTSQQKVQVTKLVATDQHVRSHEQAHLAAAGGYARGGASFTYERGPDGQLYAIAGEVGIDASPVPGDPKATARKAETVREAALAPSDPSDQDRAVASAATQMEQTAQRQLDRLQQTALLSGASDGQGYTSQTDTAGTLLSIIA